MTNSSDYERIGNKLLSEEKFLEAVKQFNKAIKLESHSPGLWLQRGCCKYFLNKYEDAISDLDKAIELDPNNAQAYAVAAGFKAMRTMQSVDKLLVEKALNMGGDNSETFSAVISAYQFGNNHPKVIELSKKYFEIVPFGQTRLRLTMLGSHIALGDNDGAKEVALKMVGSDEFSDFWGKLFLIFLEEKSGDKEKANALYTDFIAKNKTNNQDLIIKIKSFP